VWRFTAETASEKIKSVNSWRSYKQEGGCLVHFLGLLAVWWPGAQSARANHFIAPTPLCPSTFKILPALMNHFLSLQENDLEPLNDGVINEQRYNQDHFYRAMLCIRGTSHGPVSVRPSVRPSVTSRCSIETDERIQLGFGMWASFHPSYAVLRGNSVISKNKGTSLWNFVLKSGLRKFCHGISIVETSYQLSSRKVDAQSVIKWAVVGQLNR